jgi:hypothetical protein
MKVREAVAAGKDYIQELFADEQIVTLGFPRPWDKPVGPLANSEPLELRPWRRDYKVVLISDATGNLTSIKNRENADAA